MAKLSFLAGFGAGYVLGARAGRERYEQIRRAWENAKDDPRLQSLAGMAQARADDAVSSTSTGEIRIGPGLLPDLEGTPHEGPHESPLVPHERSLRLLRQMDELRRQVGVRYPSDEP